MVAHQSRRGKRPRVDRGLARPYRQGHGPLQRARRPMSRPLIGRMAPSPTGQLHLGNVRSLALAWLAAKAQGGQIYLRIEDLAPAAAASTAELIADLAWLGLAWDAPDNAALHWPEPAGQAWWVQSQRGALYAAVVDQLLAAGRAYPCVCTRKDIERAATAPHAEDGGPVYPGTCRGRFATVGEARAWEVRQAEAACRAPMGCAVRLKVADQPLHFNDMCRGPQTVDVAASAGDIVIARKDGGFAYMLAVVVDDLAMGVTQVVRGDDLLAATGQQLAIYQAIAELAVTLAAQPGPLQPFWQRAMVWQPPDHAHVALVVGDDGRRLAKRNQSVHLQQIRAAGVTAADIRRWVAQTSGVPTDTDWMAMAQRFDWGGVARQAVLFGEAALAKLLRR